MELGLDRLQLISANRNAIMPLEPPNQQCLQAAVGYVELGMFAEADAESDKIDPFCRALPKFSP